MSNIYVKDNGTLISFTIKDDKGVVDLTGATVTATLKKGIIIFKKEVSIIDSENGQCQLILTDSDTSVEGRYNCQLTVQFSNGNQFSSNINYISISPVIIMP